MTTLTLPASLLAARFAEFSGCGLLLKFGAVDAAANDDDDGGSAGAALDRADVTAGSVADNDDENDELQQIVSDNFATSFSIFGSFEDTPDSEAAAADADCVETPPWTIIAGFSTLSKHGVEGWDCAGAVIAFGGRMWCSSSFPGNI